MAVRVQIPIGAHSIMEPSSKWLGYKIFILGIGGSNPHGSTNKKLLQSLLSCNENKNKSMIAPKKIKDYPKFLRCNEIVKGWGWNKHLLMPWNVGELVKVAPESEQHSSPYVGSKDEVFRKTYVVIYRKDKEGKFAKRQTAEWRQFDLITKSKHK